MAQNRPFRVNWPAPAPASNRTASSTPSFQSSTAFGWSELALPSPAPPARSDVTVRELVEAPIDAVSWTDLTPGAAAEESVDPFLLCQAGALRGRTALSEGPRRKRNRLSTPETTTLAQICVTNKSAYGIPGKTGAYWTMIAAELEQAIGHPFSNVRQRMDLLAKDRQIQLQTDETGTTARVEDEQSMAVDAWLAVVNEVEAREEARAGHVAKKRKETADAAKEKDFLMLGAAAQARVAADLPDEAETGLSTYQA